MWCFIWAWPKKIPSYLHLPTYQLPLENSLFLDLDLSDEETWSNKKSESALLKCVFSRTCAPRNYITKELIGSKLFDRKLIRLLHLLRFMNSDLDYILNVVVDLWGDYNGCSFKKLCHRRNVIFKSVQKQEKTTKFLEKFLISTAEQCS